MPSDGATRLGGVGALACAAWAMLGAGCDRSGPSAADASPVPGAPSGSGVASAASGDASRPRAFRWGEAVSAAARLPCRAVAADGDVRAEDVALPGSAHAGKAPGADAGAGLALGLAQEIPVDSWLRLGPTARLVAKDPRTTRETTFRGPGRARPCVGRREESWVASGAFESVVGAGESPGSEEWLVTPLAVLRYAAAGLRVSVGSSANRSTSVAPVSGLAFLWLAHDARARWMTDAGAGDAGGKGGGGAAVDGWERVADAPVTIEPIAPVAPVPGARTAVEACTALANRSHELATTLMAPSVGLPDASVAADAVVARRLARAACAVAALRLADLPDAPAKDALAASLKDAVEAWTALPSPE